VVALTGMQSVGPYPAEKAVEKRSSYTYRILGAFEVRRDGRRIEIPRGNALNLLATLVLNANALMTADVLYERLWGDRPPKTARAVLQNCVSQLRSPHDARAVPLPILTGPKGYSIRVPPGAIDLHQFDSMAARAEEALAAGRQTEAADLLHDALLFWSGDPLPEITAPGLRQTEIRHLAERRAAILDRWADLEIGAGRAGRVIPDLRAAVAATPAEERLRYQLVRALVGNQQIGEASRYLRETETILRERYGLEAGPILERWWRQLLAPVSAADYRLPHLVNL